MARILRDDQAAIDISEIAVHIARDNPKAAWRFLDETEEKLALLAEHPGMGELRPELGREIRSFSILKFHCVIFFRPLEDGIEVARVLHGSRDADCLFLD